MAAGRSVSAGERERQRLRSELAGARARVSDSVDEVRQRLPLGLGRSGKLRLIAPVLGATAAGLLLALAWRRTRVPRATGGRAGESFSVLRSTLWSLLLRGGSRYLEHKLLALAGGGRAAAPARGMSGSLRGDQRP